MADWKSASLILPDCPEQNFLRASIGIKEPCTILYQRYGEGPVFRADIQYRGSVGFSDQTVHLLIFLAEPLAFKFVLDFVGSTK